MLFPPIALSQKWYPPAETSIPVALLLRSICRRIGDASVEKHIRDLTESRYCIFGPTGRSLLYCLLKALKQKLETNRDEVLIPGYTCYSVAAAVVKAGLKIRLYDLDQKTFDPVKASLENGCSSRTLAIISQHLFGIVTDVSPIRQMASDIGAFHIEDGAQGFGGQFNDMPIGSQSDFALFSFGRGKPLPLGSGGALVSNRFSLQEFFTPFRKASGLFEIGMTAISQLMAKPQFYQLAERLPLGLGQTVFDPNFTVGSDPEAIRKLLIHTIPHLNRLNTHRREIAAVYRECLPEYLLFDETKGARSVYVRFPVLINLKSIPEELYRMGVRRMYPLAIGQDPGISCFVSNRDMAVPGAVAISNKLVTLPTHAAITSDIASKISDTIKARIADL